MDSLDVEAWLRKVEDVEGLPPVLMLLDNCHAGAALDAGWRLRLGERRKTWVLAVEDAVANLSQIWAGHLASAHDPALDVWVAYYAHHLRRAGAQGREVDDPGRLDLEAQAMVLAWVGQLGAPEEIAQGRVSAPLRQALSWVADRYGLDHELVRRFVARFFREVLTSPDSRSGQ